MSALQAVLGLLALLALAGLALSWVWEDVRDLLQQLDDDSEGLGP